MTGYELNKISLRIDAINEAMELCSEDGRDDDVLDNLTAELDSLIALLEVSEAKAKRFERGPKLTLIRGA